MLMAIHVRKDNLDYIMDFAAKRGFNLDYLDDNRELALEYGFETYLITDGTEEANNRTFTAMDEPSFRQYWKFTEHENPNHFVKIEHV